MKKLFTVIRQGKLDEVKRIIEHNPDLVNCVSGVLPKKDHGQSPLQVAFKAGKYEIADYLIEHGADVNFMEAEDEDPGLRAPVLFDAIVLLSFHFAIKDSMNRSLHSVILRSLWKEAQM